MSNTWWRLTLPRGCLVFALWLQLDGDVMFTCRKMIKTKSRKRQVCVNRVVARVAQFKMTQVLNWKFQVIYYIHWNLWQNRLEKVMENSNLSSTFRGTESRQSTKINNRLIISFLLRSKKWQIVHTAGLAMRFSKKNPQLSPLLLNITK